MNGNAPRRMADVRLGKDACFDAWLYNLFIDNNLVHDLNPHIVASPEQLKFMVAGGPGSVYLPCSDAMFALLCEPTMPRRLQKEYNRAWRILVRLVRSLVTDRMQRRALLLFCRYRFRSAVAQHTLLPPRLIKRMTNIVLAQGLGDGDPWRQRRHALNILQREILRSESVRTALEGMPVAPLPDTLEAARARLDACSLVRHLFLSAYTLELETAVPDRIFLEEEFHRAEQKAAELESYLDELASRPRTILYLCDADGGVVFDLAVVRKLLRMQHRVIFAVKDGFFFYAPTLDDVEEDPVLREELKQDYIVRDAHLSKNQLLRHLREHRLLVISDGTRERLNLYRVSISFSRAWKEADLILAKGWRSADMLLGTSCEFTRDILCYWHDGADMHLALRRHAPGVKKLTEQDVAAHADGIIARMQRFLAMTGLPEPEAEVLVQSRAMADFFEAAAAKADARKVANFILGPLLRELNARSLHVQDCAMTPEALAELVSIVDKGLISAKIANDIFADLMENGAMPEAYVKEKGLVQISDSSALEAAVDKVLADNPAEVEAFRGGKTKLISFFVGQVMRATRGKANPALVNELLAKKLAG